VAYELAQVVSFENVQYDFDRDRDVLYISFGTPVPALAVQVEDWLAVRISLGPPPRLVGLTIVGFRRIFEKAHRYIERELPERIERLSRTSISIGYSDETDTLIMREDQTVPVLSVFEPLAENLYVEKSVPAKDVVGIKIVNFTRFGPEAIKALFGAIVDSLFEDRPAPQENADLVTKAVLRRFDWQTLARLAA